MDIRMNQFVMFLTKASYQPFVFVADKDYFQTFTGRDHLHSKNLI